VVADKTSEEWIIGSNFFIGELYFNFGVVIFEVRVASAGSDINSFADVRVSDESLVLFIRVAVEYCSFYFASDFTFWSDGAVFFDDTTGHNDGIFSDIAGADNDGIVHNDGTFVYNDNSL